MSAGGLAAAPVPPREQREAHDQRVVSYLLETPNLGDLIEQGLAELGYSILGEEMRL